MAAGLPDLVDCLRFAADAVEVRREYELGDLPRLRDVLAHPRGVLAASISFSTLADGRAGAEVRIEATPWLTCQRCLEAVGWAVKTGSKVEFAASEEADGGDGEREFYRMQDGLVSLCALAEEELLLALPIAPACASPSTCGKSPSWSTLAAGVGRAGTTRQPFSALRDLMKKT